VRRRAVEVEVVLLHVLAVVALGVRDTERTLLDDRVGAVPEREGEAEPLLVVAEAGEAVLAPAIGARARLVVAQVIPGIAGRAVVLADGAPLALGEVRTPAPPPRARVAGLFEPASFRVGHLVTPSERR
jgi:hypothetical protein